MLDFLKYFALLLISILQPVSVVFYPMMLAAHKLVLQYFGENENFKTEYSALFKLSEIPLGVFYIPIINRYSPFLLLFSCCSICWVSECLIFFTAIKTRKVLTIRIVTLFQGGAFHMMKTFCSLSIAALFPTEKNTKLFSFYLSFVFFGVNGLFLSLLYIMFGLKEQGIGVEKMYAKFWPFTAIVIGGSLLIWLIHYITKKETKEKIRKDKHNFYSSLGKSFSILKAYWKFFFVAAFTENIHQIYSSRKSRIFEDLLKIEDYRLLYFVERIMLIFSPLLAIIFFKGKKSQYIIFHLQTIFLPFGIALTYFTILQKNYWMPLNFAVQIVFNASNLLLKITLNPLLLTSINKEYVKQCFGIYISLRGLLFVTMNLPLFYIFRLEKSIESEYLNFLTYLIGFSIFLVLFSLYDYIQDKESITKKKKNYRSS